MKVAKIQGAFLLPSGIAPFSVPRTVLHSELSRRECVALARLARQPVPRAVSLPRSSRNQRGQSRISRDALRSRKRISAVNRAMTHTATVSVSASAADWPKRIRDMRYVGHDDFVVAR